jgi:hypothetical protein
MSKPVLQFCDHSSETDSKTESPRLLMHVQFNADAVAEALGVPPPDLLERMWETLARALCVDAAQLAETDMRAKGLTFPIDGVPDGWPLQYLVAVVVRRLYPEKRQ